MKILFLDAYYDPEIIAYTHLEKDLIEELLAAGHSIDIICPLPTRGIDEAIREEYKGIKEELQHEGRVRVTRFWAPKEDKNPILRAFRYFWCNFRTYQIAKAKEEIDIVFSNSTPPTQGAIAAIVAKALSQKKKKHIPFIYNLQDIFPDSLVNTGLTSYNSLLWKIGRKIENFIYRNADKIIVISESFKRNLLDKLVPEEKIKIIPNWIDIDSVQPVLRNSNELITEFNLNAEDFHVLYAGNFGAAQGADIVLECAKLLTDYNDIKFIIFGSGAYFEDACKKAQSMDNVFIHELMQQNRVSEVYSLGDVALITCKLNTSNAGMPSKTWSIMACNVPIIASFDTDSDLAKILKQTNAGICVEPENAGCLAKAILNQYLNKGTGKCNSRDYVVNNVSKKHCTSMFIDEFLDTLKVSK